uniref:acetolactate synthase small subunit n=1 Tax=Analipus japonicus TaxID=31333 RepID=UPI002E7A1F3F|nr:acetolactate synthase small subunit [Analipus japonicus]WAM61935.1 acetolactate synthase small subunit [Analipus japonicus]
MKKTISVLVEKDSGGLARIISLLTRRRFLIDSITIGRCEREYFERLMIVVIDENDGNDSALQLTKQLRKLLNVIEVQDISDCESVRRELLLIKIQANFTERTEILNLAKILGFRIIDIGELTISLEATSDPQEITLLQKELKSYKILELFRTGEIALTRE